MIEHTTTTTSFPRESAPGNPQCAVIKMCFSLKSRTDSLRYEAVAPSTAVEAHSQTEVRHF